MKASHRRQRGAALLMAMLTVTLVATFAAASMWQQWRSVEVEQAERTRVQAGWILTGALDWARLILREDNAAADYLSEPWAVPLEEARLSTFLAAEKGVATVTSGDEAIDAFLSGEIIDMQSMLNVNDLVESGQVSPVAMLRFRRLFELLGLPASQLTALAENLRFALDTSVENRSSPMAPLVPQQMEQLVWLGVAPQTVSVIKPYVTLLPLPNRPLVNLNTAKAEVIYASVAGLSMADAQRLVAARDRSYFRSVAEASRLVPALDPSAFGSVVGVASGFFESHGRLRLGTTVIEERSLLHRVSPTVRALRRERGVAQAPPPGSTLPGR